MKFFNLFKKELRELVTVGTLASVLVSLIIFFFLGQVMGNIGEDMAGKQGSVVILDEDGSPETAQAVEMLRGAGYDIMMAVPGSDSDLTDQAAEHDHSSVLVFPKGFGAGLTAGEPQQLRIVSRLTSFSMMSNSDSSASAAAQIVGEGFSSRLLQERLDGADVSFLKAPVTTVDVTVANGKSGEVNPAMLQSMAMQQSIFIPIIVFLLITFASQLNASAIATEKGDKTLETLLSAPVSRITVLSAKMCASGVLSLLMAAVYMIGLSSYMGGMMGGSGATEAVSGITAVMQSLGLTMQPVQYLLLGVQLFLTIMIALAASMVLGALAKDVKAASSLMMPLMFMAMIPYFVSLFMDVSGLPLVAQILLYLIPFTHTFTASANLLFGHDLIFYAGMAYQALLLIGVMALAVHVFSTDKIFTMTLGGQKGRRRRAASSRTDA